MTERKRPPGRPRRAETLAHKLMIYMDDDRKAAIREAAEADGVSVSQWMLNAADLALRAGPMNRIL